MNLGVDTSINILNLRAITEDEGLCLISGHLLNRLPGISETRDVVKYQKDNSLNFTNFCPEPLSITIDAERL
ncbi:hypothetical protein K1719_034217 [Acacia pycnantha]|nr:hypothetical protein K1719_034217 [Acacia pycnantha]